MFKIERDIGQDLLTAIPGGGGGGVHHQHAALLEPHVAAELVVRVAPVLVGAAEVVPGAVGCKEGRYQVSR